MSDVIRLTDFLRQSDQDVIKRIKDSIPKIKEMFFEGVPTTIAETDLCRALGILNSRSNFGRLIKKRYTNIVVDLSGNSTFMILEFRRRKLSGMSAILEIHIYIGQYGEYAQITYRDRSYK